MTGDTDDNALSSASMQTCECCGRFKLCKMYMLQNCTAAFVCKTCRNPKGNNMAQDNETKHAGLSVKGYKSQSDMAVQRVHTMNEVEENVLRILDKLASDPTVDKRWLAIGRTHIETGFMAANRSVFKPDRVKLPGDDLTSGFHGSPE